MKISWLLIFPLMASWGKVCGQKMIPASESSKIEFTIKNFGISTKGDFKDLQGSIFFNLSDLANSYFDVSVDASSIDTDINARDNHLRKGEYFNVAKYPRISFRSTKITNSTKPGTLFLFGNLTIKGITKEISFPFKATPQPNGTLFEGSFKLNRRDFGVGGSSISLSDNLTVNLSVLARKI